MESIHDRKMSRKIRRFAAPSSVILDSSSKKDECGCENGPSKTTIATAVIHHSRTASVRDSSLSSSFPSSSEPYPIMTPERLARKQRLRPVHSARRGGACHSDLLKSAVLATLESYESSDDEDEDDSVNNHNGTIAPTDMSGKIESRDIIRRRRRRRSSVSSEEHQPCPLPEAFAIITSSSSAIGSSMDESSRQSRKRARFQEEKKCGNLSEEMISTDSSHYMDAGTLAGAMETCQISAHDCTRRVAKRNTEPKLSGGVSFPQSIVTSSSDEKPD